MSPGSFMGILFSCMVDQSLFRLLLWFLCLLTRSYLRFSLYFLDSLATWSPFGTSLQFFFGRFFDQLLIQPFLVILAWYLTRSYLRYSLLVMGSP